MKFKIPILLFYTIILSSIIILLFSIKYKVILQYKELNWINYQISEQINSLQILKAELAYLTTPERINRLQKKYLNFIIKKNDIKSLKRE